MNNGGPAEETSRQSTPEPPGLGPPQTTLVERLDSGVGSVSDEDREKHDIANDHEAWSHSELREKLGDLYDAQEADEDLSPIPFSQARRELSELFAHSESEHLVRALLHHPGHLLGVVLPELLFPGGVPASKVKALRVWMVFAVCVEALWEHVTSDGGRAHRHLEPLAARTRFLTLSEPFRRPGSESWMVWWGTEKLKHVFGHSNTWVELLRRVREARDVWREHLDRHQSLPLFDHASPTTVEEEVGWLAFQEPRSGRSRYSGGPLALSGPILEGSGEERKTWPPAPTAADRAVLGEVVERHLLPRFAVVAAWSAVLGLYRHPRHKGALVMYGLLAGALLAALTLVGSALFIERVPISGALYGIGFFYCLVGVGTLFLGRMWAMPLLLRLPAAGAVGLIVLVAFHPSWWQNVALGWWLPLLLGGAAFGYLVVEARNHNTGSVTRDLDAPSVLAGRALAVTATGLVHSLFVAVVGMVVVTPVFGEDGSVLRGVWEGTSKQGDPVAILLASTFWCLAAGVFSQILWDDQPITAPLSHRRWRER